VLFIGISLMGHANSAVEAAAGPRWPALFTPFQVKSLRLKNRVMSTSHAPGYAVAGKPLEQYIAYHEEKAKGGLALTSFGGICMTHQRNPDEEHKLGMPIDWTASSRSVNSVFTIRE